MAPVARASPCRLRFARESRVRIPGCWRCTGDAVSLSFLDDGALGSEMRLRNAYTAVTARTDDSVACNSVGTIGL